LVQVALLLRFHLFELVGRIASAIATDAGSRDKIGAAEKLLAVLVDYFEIEILGDLQPLRVGDGEPADSRGDLWVGVPIRAADPQNCRQQDYCAHGRHHFIEMPRKASWHRRRGGTLET
jgi:hypothetical protein